MLEKNKIIYLILGIGIGIVVTSTLYILYPKIEHVQLTDDMVIERAKDLGMVSIKENIKLEKERDDNLKKEDVKEEIENQAEPDNTQEPEEKKDIQEPIKVEETKIDSDADGQVVVEEGWGLTKVAIELYDKRIINDKEEFMDFVRNKNLSKSIKVGTYKIEKNEKYDEILKIITKRPR